MSSKSSKSSKNNLTPAQIDEAAKKVVKKQNKIVGAGGNQRPDKTAQTEPGDNRKYINHSLRLANLPKASLQNADQVRERIKQYFEICAEDDMKPSVAGLALAFDVDRTFLYRVRVGEKGNDFEVVNLLKKAVQILDLQMVDYMQNGKINPVSGIFLMKNNFGYSNKQEITVTAQDPLGDTKDQKQLEEQYIESVVVEPDEKESDY